jgi:hypothetical protein
MILDRKIDVILIYGPGRCYWEIFPSALSPPQTCWRFLFGARLIHGVLPDLPINRVTRGRRRVLTRVFLGFIRENPVNRASHRAGLEDVDFRRYMEAG